MAAVQKHDLRSLPWSVTGYLPTSWSARSMEMGFAVEPEIPPLPAHVPGSVQGALLQAGILSDWYHGLDSRNAEWVENRDWMYSVELPNEWMQAGQRIVLNCGGLDGNGLVVFNKKIVGRFDNAFIPYALDLSEHVRPSGNELHVVFCVPPRWLGQMGYTSQMKDWKPRFNYTWDWIPRLVQIGPWEPLVLSISDQAAISVFRARADWDLEKKSGRLWVKGVLDGAADKCRVRVSLSDGNTLLSTHELTAKQFASGTEWPEPAVEPWWPKGMGDPKLYTLRCELIDETNQVVDVEQCRTGFKNIVWAPCRNAPAQADPWICVVNGTPLFLQGINWTPIRPTFADLTEEDYVQRIETYVQMGVNIFRVWGGAFLEKSCFYDLCDRHGILVWQEFPLSSAGHENWPHEDEPSMEVLARIAESYIARRQHHASLLMWCGGNELQGAPDGSKTGTGKPVGLDHPLMQRWQALVEREDPGRRFVPTSASGPSFLADEKNFGQGVHWDVHGPWKPPGESPADWAKYWNADDALIRTETGAPGASSVEMIREYSGGMETMPANMENRLWQRFSWWIEWNEFLKEKGKGPHLLEEYVEWSQSRQALALEIAVRASKIRFPGIGGIFFWMGHDAFPCLSNTSLLDFHGVPKPAALAIGKIWNTSAEELAKDARF